MVGALALLVSQGVACGPGMSTPDGSSGDAAVTSDTGAGGDAAAQTFGDGGVGAMCSFNRDCAMGLRCECSESAGCACAMGARGTGVNGVTRCTSGNDCASSVCVEGPDMNSYCSDACMTDMNCTGMLPRCIDVSFVGRICVRTPPSGG